MVGTSQGVLPYNHLTYDLCVFRMCKDTPSQEKPHDCRMEGTPYRHSHTTSDLRVSTILKNRRTASP